MTQAERKERTRAQIEAAGIKCFSKKPFDAVTMEEIAAQAQYTKRTVYNLSLIHILTLTQNAIFVYSKFIGFVDDHVILATFPSTSIVGALPSASSIAPVS